MCDRLVIVGAGGHGKVVADIAIENGYTNICFVDDRATGFCMDFPIVGTTAQLESMNDGETVFVLAIGANAVRKALSERCALPWATLIHPAAQIGHRVRIGEGTVVMAGAVINPCAEIGVHCIINSAAVVEHDNVLEGFVHISPNAALGGTVHIGECTHIGIGATVINNINICQRARIGAGAVVIKHIEESGTYVGLPARKIK